ncbi:hypothetical protein HGRIS_001820 [Hohenbuehelia grisea]|uniref:Cyclase n=1 Tax=Hohenbuehelia grisea TaxID=104357 RepID=A0ABR3JJU8_9AGAR
MASTSTSSTSSSTFVDLSHTLESGIQVYPGDPSFAIHSVASVTADGYSVKAIAMGSHSGTHVDAPSHFFQDGHPIDALPISSFIGRALVIDLTAKTPKERITWADLASYSERMQPGVVVLLNTGWPKYWGTPEYFKHPFLERDAAKRLIATGVRALGIDALNPDETVLHGEPEGGFGVHEVVLGAGGVIVENLTNLHQLDGDMMVNFVPLKLSGSDGSPVRAFAWKI